MLGHELEGLRALGVPTVKWSKGTSYRVKVRGEHGRVVYVSNITNTKTQKLVASFYKISLAKVRSHLSPDFKHEKEKYVHTQGRMFESHLYEHIPAGDFYDRLENVLQTQVKAFKFNIQLGYTLVDHDGVGEREWRPSNNTLVFDTPQMVNSKSDIRKLVSEIRSMELGHRIGTSNFGSQYKIKSINAFDLRIFYREHRLGSSEAVIPKEIRLNKHVINFKSTQNKCVFHCIAYHQRPDKSTPFTRIQKLVKESFKRYCAYKGWEYSLALCRNFMPIDILELDELEDCFKLNINTFVMDEENGEFSWQRRSDKTFDDTLNILNHSSHAMYITNVDKFLSKYQCPKCQMIFSTCERLRNHKKNQCEREQLESYMKKPSLYRLPMNMVKSLTSKYKLWKQVPDHYPPHFIVYDFEAMLVQADEQHGPRTRHTAQHVPVSVSICDSLTNEVKCFINESPKQLLVEMFDYVHEVADKIKAWNEKKFAPIIKAVEANAEKERAAGEKWVDDTKKLDCIRQIPLIGFNSGKYDVNLIRNHLFEVLGNDIKHSIKAGSGYMCLATWRLKVLDISNYISAETSSYESYLGASLGSCKCTDMVRCLCGLSKGLFPYDYLTSYDVLDRVGIPLRSAFDNVLKGTKLSDEEYERVKFLWSHYGMKTFRDWLVYYNNQDVVPFVKAIQAQQAIWRRFELDMFMDGISLPGLAEKATYRYAYEGLVEPPKTPAPPFLFPTRRFAGYKNQDEKAEGSFDMTIEHLNSLLQNQDYLCALCYCPLNNKIVSADRIDNKKGHKDGNIQMTCVSCNTARGDTSIAAFRQKKLLEYISDRLVFSIDIEQKHIYKLMRENVVGGPSIIFNRYAKCDETYIRGGDKLVQTLIGYDANALYPWALGSEMPCGRLASIEPYDEILDDIQSNKLFGFLACDIETPEDLKEHFAEFCPIFKNVEIDPSNKNLIGNHMYAYNVSRKTNAAKKNRKLIASYFGT